MIRNALHVVERAEPDWSLEPWVLLLPGGFRFSEINPMTEESYAASRFGDLPPFVTAQVPVDGASWNALVDSGEVHTVVDTDRWFCLAAVHGAAVARLLRDSARPTSACGDCWGTWVYADPDGSLTGVRGHVVWCVCVPTLAQQRWVASLRESRHLVAVAA